MFPSNLLNWFNNPLFSGGFLLMISGAVMALCRNVPTRLWDWFKRQCVVEVKVTSDDPLFEWISIWLHEHPYSRKTRSLIASSLARGYDDPTSTRYDVKVIFSPSHGNHFFRYRHKFIWLSRGQDGDGNKSPQGGASSSNLRRTESYNLRVLGRKQGVIRDLIEDARKIAKVISETTLNVYISGSYGWSRLTSSLPRSLDTVVLPKGEAARILADMRKFLNRPEWYLKRGIPYHRGYLLYGLAGTGKSSLISALAGELHMPLYVLSLNGLGMDDEKMAECMRSAQPKSIILLEDIDAAVHTREDEETKKQTGVTLSGLLNCLDGVMAKDGCIIVMTTNYIDRLDKALIRPGRADYKLNFKEADRYQIETIYDKFSEGTGDTKDKEKFVSTMLAVNATMAVVQEALMERFG